MPGIENGSVEPYSLLGLRKGGEPGWRRLAIADHANIIYAALAGHIIENNMINGETIRIDGAIRMAAK